MPTKAYLHTCAEYMRHKATNKELSSLACSSLLIEGQRNNSIVNENQEHVNPSTYGDVASIEILLPGSSQP